MTEYEKIGEELKWQHDRTNPNTSGSMGSGASDDIK
jgi:hypothetical protein